MVTRETLCEWVVEAIRSHGGRAYIIDISKYVWDHYASELKQAGELFYTWQYDLRWAGQVLRGKNILKPIAKEDRKKRLPWILQDEE